MSYINEDDPDYKAFVARTAHRFGLKKLPGQLTESSSDPPLPPPIVSPELSAYLSKVDLLIKANTQQILHQKQQSVVNYTNGSAVQPNQAKPEKRSSDPLLTTLENLTTRMTEAEKELVRVGEVQQRYHSSFLVQNHSSIMASIGMLLVAMVIVLFVPMGVEAGKGNEVNAAGPSITSVLYAPCASWNLTSQIFYSCDGTGSPQNRYFNLLGNNLLQNSTMIVKNGAYSYTTGCIYGSGGYDAYCTSPTVDASQINVTFSLFIRNSAGDSNAWKVYFSSGVNSNDDGSSSDNILGLSKVIFGVSITAIVIGIGLIILCLCYYFRKNNQPHQPLSTTPYNGYSQF